MTAIARLRKALLPGNRASRVIARLPKPAQVGSLRVDLDRPHIAPIDDPFIGEAAPQVSSMEDLTPSAQIQQITVPPLLSVDIVGTIFEQGANEQRGTALDMPPPHPRMRVRRAPSRGDGGLTAAPWETFSPCCCRSCSHPRSVELGPFSKTSPCRIRCTSSNRRASSFCAIPSQAPSWLTTWAWARRCRQSWRSAS